MSDREPVLVIGGTGGTGRLIVERLVARGTAVRALARNPDAAGRVLDRRVEIVRGDLTRPDTLPAVVRDAGSIILTAGIRSGWPARESLIRATEFEGVRGVLGAAQENGFAGRLLYMTSIGVGTPSLVAMLLNAYKGNTLRWRLRAEEEIRRSGLAYTIVRAGFLLNRRAGARPVRITQEALPLSLRFRIARADVAEVFVAALDSPHASRTTLEAVWGRRRLAIPIAEQLARLVADPGDGGDRREGG